MFPDADFGGGLSMVAHLDFVRLFGSSFVVVNAIVGSHALAYEIKRKAGCGADDLIRRSIPDIRVARELEMALVVWTIKGLALPAKGHRGDSSHHSETRT